MTLHGDTSTGCEKTCSVQHDDYDGHDDGICHITTDAAMAFTKLSSSSKIPNGWQQVVFIDHDFFLFLSSCNSGALAFLGTCREYRATK